jgi:hypothetical protein
LEETAKNAGKEQENQSNMKTSEVHCLKNHRSIVDEQETVVDTSVVEVVVAAAAVVVVPALHTSCFILYSVIC